VAHTLKGAVGTFSARRAYEAALRLETLGRDRTLAEAAPALAELQEALTSLQRALTAFDPSTVS
jgi:HPt (histidine-containing phosphotransfer) domain-containing protein